MVTAGQHRGRCTFEVNRRFWRRNGCSTIRHDAVARAQAAAIFTGSQARLDASSPARAASAVTSVSAGRWRRYSPKHSFPRVRSGRALRIAAAARSRRSSTHRTSAANPIATTVYPNVRPNQVVRSSRVASATASAPASTGASTRGSAARHAA